MDVNSAMRENPVARYSEKASEMPILNANFAIYRDHCRLMNYKMGMGK
jgi:hypothetical protein